MARKHDRQRGLMLAGLMTAGWLAAGLAARVPPIWAVLGAVNLATFCMYGYDKRQARRSRWRVPEAVLHTLAILGGSAGALAGQSAFRHKTRKRSFRIVFWLILLVQVGAVAGWWWLRVR
jgi:uncharacterized membrane protein YsdA (DUF1294 family)